MRVLVAMMKNRSECLRFGLGAYSEKAHKKQKPEILADFRLLENGVDGTRTRGLRRDRPAF